jgi:hypothetical protein
MELQTRGSTGRTRHSAGTAFVLLWETTRIARAMRKRVSYLRFFGLVCEVAMPGWSGGFAGPALPLGWCLLGTGGRGQVGG